MSFLILVTGNSCSDPQLKYTALKFATSCPRDCETKIWTKALWNDSPYWPVQWAYVATSILAYSRFSPYISMTCHCRNCSSIVPPNIHERVNLSQQQKGKKIGFTQLFQWLRIVAIVARPQKTRPVPPNLFHHSVISIMTCAFNCWARHGTPTRVSAMPSNFYFKKDFPWPLGFDQAIGLHYI